MNTQDTGGPAFPFNHFDLTDAEHGMTLRDYFAANAMQAEMTQGVHERDFLETACRSYKMADAMLAARSAT